MLRLVWPFLVPLLLLVFAAPAWVAEPAGVDRYGDPLPPRAIARLGGNRLRHTGGVFPRLVYSPDGRFLAFSGERRVYVWQARSGRLLQLLTGHKGELSGMDLSPDGKILATGGEEGILRLWRVSDGRLLRQWKPHRKWVTTLAFSPDGKILASGGDDDDRVRLWNAASGAEVRCFHTGFAHLKRIAFAPDGKTLAASYQSIQLWDVATGENKTARVESGLYEALRFAADGKSLAAGEYKTVRLLDAATLDVKHTFSLKGIATVALTPDGKILAGGGEDGIMLWDVAGGKKRRTIKTSLWVQNIVFSPDGRTLATAYLHGTSMAVALWNPSTGEERTPLPGHVFSISLVAWSADGRKLITGDDKGKVRLWDAATARPLALLSQQSEELKSFPVVIAGTRFLPPKADNDRIMAVEDVTDGIRLRDGKTGATIADSAGGQGKITAVALSPDGKTLAAAGWDGSVLLWDVTGSRRPPALDVSDRELQTLWEALAAEEAWLAQDAVWRLAAVPERAVSFLVQRVRAVSPVSGERMKQRLSDLDSDSFAIREKATGELARLGKLAVPDLRRALTEGPSLEMRRRIEDLLARCEGGLSPEERRGVRAVRVLELASTATARRHLKSLAAGAEGAPQTAEARNALRGLGAAGP